MLLMSNLSNNDSPKIQEDTSNKIKADTSNKKNKKKKINEMTDEEYQECLDYQEHNL